MGKGSKTRERILQIANSAVLAKGFGATSIEELIAEAGITKSGFFYHFKDKGELARALLVNYIEMEEKLFNELFGKAAELSEDPLQSFLIALNLLAKLMEDMPDGHPGCLVATYCYQERLFDREILGLSQKAMLSWRDRFRRALSEIAAIYPSREPVDLDELADFLSTVIEGAIIVSRVLSTPKALSRQILLYRQMIKLLFLPDVMNPSHANELHQGDL